MRWQIIGDFPGYSIGDEGQVRNDSTDRIMSLSQNQHGIVQVGLMRDGRQHKRAVALLVAYAYLEPPALETFNAVINLDGDRTNNNYWNLAWRPRWFAVRYHRQFDGHEPCFNQPIREINTKERFKNSMDAAVKYGLLDREILIATLNRTYVWPTYQEFRVVGEEH